MTETSVKNFCILGHSGSGKTTFIEKMLHMMGESDRLGRVEEGNTISDYDNEEIKRKISIYSTPVFCNVKQGKLQFIDTPGFYDFVGEVIQACRVSDAAIISVCAKAGVEVGTEKAWGHANSNGLKKIVLINKMDIENANYDYVLAQLKNQFGAQVIPFLLPMIQSGAFVGVVDVLSEKSYKLDKGKMMEVDVPKEMVAQVQECKEAIMEAIADTEEGLMEKYFGGEAFTEEEIKRGIAEGIENGQIVPVFCSSSYLGIGIPQLIEFLHQIKSVNKLNVSGPTKLFVFKTIVDPFIGKLSLFRVMQGSLKSDQPLYNLNTGMEERVGHIYLLKGKKQIETKLLSTGEIGALAKLNKTFTGNTLSTDSKETPYLGMEYPEPSIDLAIVPKAKGDEEKISQGLQRLKEEDYTIDATYNAETHQTVIYGLGEVQLEILISKLKNKFGVEVELTQPKVAYRETIKGKAKVEGKHKKQTGGHGQYGHVWMEFEPAEVEMDLLFEEKIFGGSVPKQYIPAVEKGLKECITHGVLAGYPVVGIKATLLDGSYHPVDSSEMAFKLATHVTYKKGLVGAKPILLEPIMKVTIVVPDAYTGDVIGDLNKRRGRVLGMDALGKSQQVVAEVPKAELYKYGADLRSMTQGRGSFTLCFVRYEEVPPMIAQQVISEQSNVG